MKTWWKFIYVCVFMVFVFRSSHHHKPMKHKGPIKKSNQRTLACLVVGTSNPKTILTVDHIVNYSFIWLTIASHKDCCFKFHNGSLTRCKSSIRGHAENSLLWQAHETWATHIMCQWNCLAWVRNMSVYPIARFANCFTNAWWVAQATYVGT